MSLLRMFSTGGVAGPAIVRALTMPISFICGMASVHILVRELGVADYGLISLLVSLQVLFSFMDLGTAAPVVNGAAEYRATNEPRVLVAPLRRALRVTAATALVAFLTASVIGYLGAWPKLLGDPGDERLTVAMLLLLGLNILGRPLIIIQSALVGIGKSTLVVGALAFVPLLNLSILFVASTLDAPFAIFAISLMVAQVATGIILAIALRREVPSWLQRVHGEQADHANSNFIGHAAPMFLITLVAPLQTSLDRVILNHESVAQQLAVYALAMQIYQPFNSLFVTVQQALWADFRIRRARRDLNIQKHFLRTQLAITSISVILGIAVLLAAPLLASFITDGAITLPLGLLAVLSTAMVFQMSQLPSAGMLTTESGLQRQALGVCLAVTVNLTLTATLSHPLGAKGPAVGTAVGAALLLLFLYYPAYRESRRVGTLEEAAA